MCEFSHHLPSRQLPIIIIPVKSVLSRVSLSRPCYAAAEYHNTVTESLTEHLFYVCVKLEYLRVMIILRLNEVIIKYTFIELLAQSNFSHQEFIFG